MLFYPFAICLLLQVANAIEVTQLQVRLNENMLMGDTKWLIYGSRVVIQNLDEWNDEQILDLAHVAHQARIVAHKNARGNTVYGSLVPRDAPTATTTMVVGNTAYISSSVKGARPFLYVDLDPAEAGETGFRFRDLRREHDQRHGVGKALVRCQLANFEKTGVTSGHRTGAACGEPMAALAYYNTHNQEPLSGAKIVTIRGGGQDPSKYQIFEPCEADLDDKGAKISGSWGCELFTELLQMHRIRTGTTRQSTEVSSLDISVTWPEYK